MPSKKTSLKQLLFGGLICAAALLLSVAGVYATRAFSNEIYRNIRESTTENVEALTKGRAQMLDKTLELLTVQAQTVAAHLAQSETAVTPADLQSFVQIHDHCLRIVAFGPDGAAVSSDQMISRVSPDSQVYRDVFAGSCGVTDTFVGGMGYKEVNVYAPILRGSSVAGGVYINLKAEALRSTDSGTLYESSGYSYLLKQDGTILLAPTAFSFAQIYPNVRDVFLLSQNNQQTVDAFMTALANGASGNAIMDFSGDMQIICFEPLAEKQDWYYVSVLPLSKVEAGGQAILHISSRMASLFVCILLVFLGLLGIVLFLMFRDKWTQEINDGRVYKALSENIHTAIFIMEQGSGLVRRAFDNMQSILGVPAQQVQGGRFSREWLAQLGLPEQAADMVEQAEASGQTATAELRHYNPALQKNTWLQISVSPLHLKGRREYMVAFTDITENKQLMEDLRASMLEAQSASAAKSNFLANMSHDIRTPMNAITGMSAIAASHIDDTPRVLDCLHKIDLSSKHLTRLINDILDMSKIESGKLALSPAPTALPEVLESLTNIVQVQTSGKEQTLVILVEQVVHETVLCDSLRLSQVLLNILSNAVKFTPKGGFIRFSIRESPSALGAEYGRYEFRVKDSGIGMSREFQKTIFESFTREKNSRIEKIEGSGLGMAISKWIVDQMNGTIQVFSEPEKGSEFVVAADLPLAAGQSLPGDLQGRSVLLVDCDQALSASTAATLTALGAAVDTVFSQRDALEHALQKAQAGQRYDAVLLDCGLNGLDFLENVRSLRACSALESASILLAAYDWSAFRQEALAAGVSGFIRPPFFASTLFYGITQTPEQTADTPEALPDACLKGIRVLIAEDNELNREICIELLVSSGVLVDAAVNGEQCFERFAASPAGYYRMVMTDIQMPVMNGYEAARNIRACNHPDAKTIPILAVTADAFAEDVEAARQAGMNGHISKPLDRAQMLAEMKKHL